MSEQAQATAAAQQEQVTESPKGDPKAMHQYLDRALDVLKKFGGKSAAPHHRN